MMDHTLLAPGEAVYEFDGCRDDPFTHFEDTNDPEELDEEWKEYALRQFGEADTTRQGLLEEFRKIVAEEFDYDLPEEEGFYLKVLRAGAMSLTDKHDPGAVSVLRNYYEHLDRYPAYFENSVHLDKLSHVLDAQVHCILPKRDKFGRRVFIHRAGQVDVSQMTFSDDYCVGYMLSELLALEPKTQISGVTVIADASGFTFRHLMSISVGDVRSATSFIQESFPIFFRVVHVVNAPRIFHYCYALFKPFMTETAKRGVIFHNSLEDLHKYVDREILPEELGGAQGKMDNRACAEALKKLAPYLKKIKAYGIHKKK